MDNMDAREIDLRINLENGGKTNEIERLRDRVTRVGQTKKLFDTVWSGFANSDGSAKDNIIPREDALDSSEVCVENVGLLMESCGRETRVDVLEKSMTPRMEKQKKKSCKKPPKPPRPTTAVQLDAADQKLVREISELAMLKRARVERMKALKKMKDAKTTTSTSSLCAMAITIIFCLIIIFQGAFSRSSSIFGFPRSPKPALAMGGVFISVRYNRNIPARGTTDLGSGSPNIVEAVSGSGTQAGRHGLSG